MAADIDPNHPGVEMWSLDSKGVRNVKGEVIASRVRGLSTNMAVWWDGDLLRELLDRNVVSKYNWEKGLCERIAVFEGALSNNGTKSTPCLQGDIVGDWREEVLLRTADNTALRLYVSTIPTDYRFHTCQTKSPAFQLRLIPHCSIIRNHLTGILIHYTSRCLLIYIRKNTSLFRLTD